MRKLVALNYKGSKNFLNNTPIFLRHPLPLPLFFALKAIIEIEAVSSAALLMLAIFVPTVNRPAILFLFVPFNTRSVCLFIPPHDWR